MRADNYLNWAMGTTQLNIPVCSNFVYVWKCTKRKMNVGTMSSVKLSAQNFPEKHI